MDNCFHSSFIPAHWSKSNEIFTLIASVRDKNHDKETWFYELLTYMMILIHESTTNIRRTPQILEYPILKSKVIIILEKIYQSMISSMKNDDVDDDQWIDYENMLSFELSHS
jgi:hypothetical protein